MSYKITKKMLKDVPAGHWVILASGFIHKNYGAKYFISGRDKSYKEDRSEVLDFGPTDPKAMPGNYIVANDGSIWKVYIAGLGEQPEVGMVGVRSDTVSFAIDQINNGNGDGRHYTLDEINRSGYYHMRGGATQNTWGMFLVCVYQPSPAENPKLMAMKAGM